MKVLAALAVVVLIVASSASAREPTAAEKAACKPDALRLCSFVQLAEALAVCIHTPRCAPIHKCFKEHRREIGPACDRVLKRHRY
jgi:hypothetical protein